MEYIQMRNGSWDVYDRGEWIGIAAQLPSGRWAFISKVADVVGIGLSIEGAVYEALKGLGNFSHDSSAAADPS